MSQAIATRMPRRTRTTKLPGRKRRSNYHRAVHRIVSTILLVTALVVVSQAALGGCGERNEIQNQDGGQGGANGGVTAVPSAGASASAGAATGGTSAVTSPPSCDVVLPTSCPTPSPVYADVQPVFAARCVTCHSGVPGGPWPLTTYGHVATWRDTIRATLANCEMPPVDSGSTLPPEESSLLLTWIRCGMPL